MKKKKLKGIFLTTIITTLLIISYLIISQIKHKKEIEKNIRNIPKFSFQNINGGIFTNQNLKKQTATIFIYFNTECEFCNEEAKMIKENMECLRDFQLIFVSFEKTETIKTFAQKYQLTTYDNIYFLSDNKVTFASTFDVKSLPSLVLYNKKQKLIEKIKGQTQIEVLIKK